MNDRIRGAAAPSPRTARPDTAVVQKLLALPSIASQLLTAAADHLAEEEPTDELTVAGWGIALALADARVLTGWPAYIAQNAARRAMRALSPDMWDGARTRGEWAICLRSAARAV
ncbi:hypothetical protein GTW29_13405 [Streptomyces sp. SID7834]|nr:hypothetical protein [Streptomyces sp. SID7834]MYT57698.1 hypothetical protein [Streptomyces sp. SID7834]